MNSLGLIIIFVSVSSIGFLKAVQYTKAYKELYAFILFLKFIKTEICVYYTRQRDIFERFENKILEQNGFLTSLRQEEIVDEKSPIYHILKKYDKKLLICDEAKNHLLEFSSNFGQMSAEEQRVRLDTTISFLEEIYIKEKEEGTKLKKSYSSLGIVLAVAIVLILI